MSSKVVALLCFAVLFSGVASADTVSFGFGSPGNLGASATFDVLGGNLQIVLINTSLYDVEVPSEVLTALFFDINGNPSLIPISALLGGSVVWFPTTDPGGVVGGEWAYASGLSGAPGGAWQGISSAGFGLFGPLNLFPGPNLQGPDSPDGLQYGITSAGDDPATGNQAVTGKNALIYHSVVFTLGNLPSDFELGDIDHVSFQYGTDLREGTFSDGETPEPASLFLVAPVILVWAAWRYRARARRRAESS